MSTTTWLSATIDATSMQMTTSIPPPTVSQSQMTGELSQAFNSSLTDTRNSTTADSVSQSATTKLTTALGGPMIITTVNVIPPKLSTTSSQTFLVVPPTTRSDTAVSAGAIGGIVAGLVLLFVCLVAVCLMYVPDKSK